MLILRLSRLTVEIVSSISNSANRTFVKISRATVIKVDAIGATPFGVVSAK